ncbi:radical SAM family heme chaperone HemW [Halobacillus karajensis]|uniref:Heme chaperone HemW n=1 Tax=Halobacillus karajensis TaxID=195088 RepID=A0A024P6J5_9BACI|nr:radical SAM family heme chaperone HemW [Halobacillus karajensis]CDQ18053.1 Oxygen-independent coproporphyrinogen-III oxidase 1 [Halobacillus karajensis]CDQ24403.1 Oxygen-independent coproporphyrinogen-III oxidase 1 [Halobacillus karajensis]CDQ29349.1 Oxygen-independent coproporphyrinogen-III oxidase 1 [Halobacillus karajensis]
MKISSAYIHIPFCQQICHYCDFTKFFYNERLADEYLEALEKEINTYIPGEKANVRTIFVGGGTPTAVNHKQLEKLLQMIDEHFDISGCEEYTFEANPGDLDQEKVRLLKAYGVDRISLGVQVFDDEMLEKIGRVHKVKDVYTNIDRLLQAGLSNISIDLMYALPGQTVKDFEKTIDEALQFDLPHYSSYSLQIEPKTVFYQRYKKGKLSKAKEDDEAEMYELLQQKLTKAGAIQYEISNFAKPGFESKHNLTYWNNEYYFGIGAGAHGYLPGKRTINIRPLPAYVKKAFDDGKPILHEEPIGLKEQLEEEMFLGLRKSKGVSKELFREKYGKTLTDVFGRKLTDLKNRELIAEDSENIRLTPKGRILGNEVFQEFLLDE